MIVKKNSSLSKPVYIDFADVQDVSEKCTVCCDSGQPVQLEANAADVVGSEMITLTALLIKNKHCAKRRRLKELMEKLHDLHKKM